ncbi:hypothetical protein [Rhizobium rhizogenes]|uniref:hypothetical protein n=1 Tax=Rhizobium rhizogenes TaxID=359 RepID=UPI0024BEB4B2|nr:hypothetical protein [Rhizobium rhizogenes]MDJ1638666.1 hypothetical protein [Rhizobium rhizogenes]
MISLRYGDNNVISIDGNAVKMRRHYVQTVAGSTIAAEVKIELQNNETIWLTPADGSSVFSNNWLGVLISAKGGVVVSEMRPLICVPVK